MEILGLCSKKNFLSLEKLLGQYAPSLNLTVRIQDEIPSNIGMHQVLCVCFEQLDITLLNKMRGLSYQYLAILDHFEDPLYPFLMRTGANPLFMRDIQNISSEQYISSLIAIIEQMKLKDLAFHLSLKELSFIRRVYQGIEVDKKKLADDLYGASSETTLDVNLARLRKKLADPKIGEDFFRIVNHKRKLYLVNSINQYNYERLQIP